MRLEAALLGELGMGGPWPAAHELDWPAFGRLSQQLVRSRDRERLLEVALELLCGPIGAAAAAVWIYRHDDSRLELVAEQGLAELDPRPDWTDLFKCPLSSAGRLLGVCEAYSLDRGGFDEVQRGALQTATALLAAGLLQTAQPAEAPLPDGLEVLWRLWRTVVRAADLSELCELLADRLPEHVAYDAAVYLNLETIPPSGLLHLRDGASLEHVRPLLERLGAALAEHGGDPTRLDAKEIELVVGGELSAEARNLESQLTIPLLRRGELIGLVHLAAREPGAFDDPTERLLTGFGSRLGEALDSVAELRRAELGQLVTIIDSLPQGVVLLDAGGAVLLCNPPGRSHLELLGAGDRVVRLGPLVLAEELAAAAQRGEDCLEREIELRLADRTWNLQVSMVPVREGDEHLGTVISIHDRSHRRQTEQRLFADARLAAVGELAAGVAHELNNPLMIILGLAEQLADTDPPPGERRRALDEIAAAALHAGRIVGQLTAFADTQLSEAWDALDLRDVAQQAVGLVAAACERDGIKVTMDWPAGLPLVQGNAGKLQQILLVLVRNAYEAMAQSPEPRPGGRIQVRARLVGDRVCVEVEDDGPGVPDELRDRVFDVFFTTKREWKGKGLGLWVAYRLAKEHGGELTVEPAPTGGALFRLSLPAADGAD